MGKVFGQAVLRGALLEAKLVDLNLLLFRCFWRRNKNFRPGPFCARALRGGPGVGFGADLGLSGRGSGHQPAFGSRILFGL